MIAAFRFRILIVEDEPLVALDLEDMVACMGHVVVGCARTASEAMRSADLTHPDVVITDVRLADGSSGIDAARDLHARFGLRSVIVSGNAPDARRAVGGDLRTLGILDKPVNYMRLERALEGAAPR